MLGADAATRSIKLRVPLSLILYNSIVPKKKMKHVVQLIVLHNIVIDLSIHFRHVLPKVRKNRNITHSVVEAAINIIAEVDQ